jgi:hypothetical protein
VSIFLIDLSTYNSVTDITSRPLCTSQLEQSLGQQRAKLQLELSQGGAWFELDPRLNELAQQLLGSRDESELPDLLEFSEPTLSLTMSVRVSLSMDRLQVEAYMKASPQTPVAVKQEMPPDYFELLSIAGFSILTCKPLHFPGFSKLSPALARACEVTHALVMDIIRLEVDRCESLSRDNFTPVITLSTLEYASAQAAASTSGAGPEDSRLEVLH